MTWRIPARKSQITQSFELYSTHELFVRLLLFICWWNLLANTIELLENMSNYDITQIEPFYNDSFFFSRKVPSHVKHVQVLDAISAN